MKKTSLAVTIAALLTVGVSTNSMAESPSMDSSMTGHSSSMTNTANIQSENYLNKEVVTANGDSVGKIDELMVNKTDHSVNAIMDVGGYLGIGEKVVAIPVNQLQMQGDKLVLSPGVTEDSLKQGKKYEKSEFSAFEIKNSSSEMPNTANVQPADYLKKEVVTSNGDSVGKIDKLVISNSDHSVNAILQVGGYLGVGGKDVAIPVNELQMQGDKLVLSPGVTEDSLKQGKKYEKSEFSAFEVKNDSPKD